MRTLVLDILEQKMRPGPELQAAIDAVRRKIAEEGVCYGAEETLVLGGEEE